MMKKMSFFFFGVGSRRSCRSSFRLSNLKKKKKSPLSLSVFPLPLQEAWQMKVQKSGCPCIAGCTQSRWPQAQFLEHNRPQNIRFLYFSVLPKENLMFQMCPPHSHLQSQT